MNCKSFNKMLLEYIEKESSGLINHEMKVHMECCPECCALYKEKLEVKASFNELFNRPDKNFFTQNNKILNELNPKYYKKSLMSKISYHLRRNKFTYSTGIAFAVLLIFAVPVMKSYMGNPSNTSKLNGGSTANTKTTSSVEKTLTTKSEVNGNHITVTDIKAENFDGKLLEISNPKKIAVGYSFSNSKADKTTSEIAISAGAVAAINGGTVYTTLENQMNFETTKMYSGIAIHEGKVVLNNLHEEASVVNLVGFNQEGLLVAGRYEINKINELGIKEGIGGIPYSFTLITKGKPIPLESKPAPEPRGPRTAIGQKADGSILLLVINGRNLDSIGANLSEVQNIFLQYGAVTAVNLDGGSHSYMYYNGEVINKPCAPSGGGPVPSIFMVMP